MNSSDTLLTISIASENSNYHALPLRAHAQQRHTTSRVRARVGQMRVVMVYPTELGTTAACWAT